MWQGLSSRPRTAVFVEEKSTCSLRAPQQVTVDTLDKLNVAQATQSNKECLDALGGLGGLAAKMKANLSKGLTDQQADELRKR
jgi:hypothetical protein